MSLMQITVVPLGTAKTGISDHIIAIRKILATENAPFKINDMGTVIEGETADLLKLAAKLHEAPFSKGAQRVMTQIVIDDRRDKKVSIGDKTAAVS